MHTRPLHLLGLGLVLTLAACAHPEPVASLADPADGLAIEAHDARWRPVPGPPGEGVLVVPLRVRNLDDVSVVRLDQLEVGLATISGPVCTSAPGAEVAVQPGGVQRVLVEVPCRRGSVPPDEVVRIVGRVRAVLGDDPQDVAIAGSVPLSVQPSAARPPARRLAPGE